MNGTKIAAWVAGIAVALCGSLGLYTAASTPVLNAPVVVRLPDAALNVVCSRTARACYLPGLPDFIWLGPDANDATLQHETLHYLYPAWSECEVSNHLYATTHLEDTYHRTGVC
jgi:hypothetical protein